MTPTEDLNHVDIAGYLLDMLDPAERQRVEEHLTGCADCRAEVDSLRGWTAQLESVPEAMRMDGPPDDADLLLQRTLRQIRDETSGRRHRRAALVTSMAAAVAAVAVAGGVLIGRATGPSPTPSPPVALPTASAPVPGTRIAGSTDSLTGARIDVAVIPAPGWVRITATVGGIPAGERCRLEVVGRDGTAVLAGSWLVSPQGEANGTVLNGSVLIPPDQVASVRVVNEAGKQFTSVVV